MASRAPARPWDARRRFRTALVLAVLTTIAAGSAIFSESPVTYQGRVVDIDGKPVLANVILSSDGRVAARATASSTGEWRISGGHRIESHRLSLAAPGYLPTSLAAVDTGRPVQAVLHRLPQLSGAVSEDDGSPLPTAEVVLVQLGRPGEWHAETGADGHFSIDGTLLPGNYRISVTATNHEPFETTATLAPDARLALAPTLVREIGNIELASTPAGMEPLVDGRPIPGCHTPCATSLPVGEHTIRIESDLYVPFEQKIQLANRQKIDLAPVLERKQGTLRVSLPAGAGGELIVDGDLAGGGGYNARLPTGNHTVSYRTDGFWPGTANVSVRWNEIAAVDLGASLIPIRPGDEAALLTGMDNYLRSFGGQYGVYIQDLTTGHEIGYHQDDVMEAASDIKIPVALYLLHQVEKNNIKMDDRIAIQDKDFMGGTGILNGAYHAGDTFNYGDLLALLIQQSDNTAWQALVRTFGADQVDAYAASLGAPDCHQNDDNCTAHEAGIMLAGLFRGKTLNPANTGLLLHLLETTAFNDRINYYLGGTLVAHKTGADGGVMNDVGIVYASSGPILISMFSVTDSGTVQPIRDVARSVVRYFSGH